jgi:hypothetical protein
MRKLFLYFKLCVVYAFPPVVSSKSTSTSVLFLTAATTIPAPTPASHYDILKRDINSNVCGWIDGDSSERT